MTIRYFYILIMLNFFPSFLNGQAVSLRPYASGLTYPIAIRNCGDGRLFVAQRGGQIRIINPDGSLLPDPFLDISDSISSGKSEEGFLSFCFSPDYRVNRKFYVSYTDSVGSNLMSEIYQYQTDPFDSNKADLSTGIRILQVRQPYQNHNGGDLHFGPDGYLYIGFGDGGSGGDPQNRAQNPDSLLGKMLRLDVSNVTPSQPYKIPANNPFADSSGTIRKEIWAIGLRNPWRSSFDRITGNFWIADVGQSNREEIDFQPAGLDSCRNYGWPIMEGTACYRPSSGCNQVGLVPPLYDYSHYNGISITGGYVYRGVQSRDLWGLYIFSDYGGGWIDGLRETNGLPDGQPIRLLKNPGGRPIAFGEDKYGELYVCLNNDGTLYRVNDTNPNHHPKAYFDTSFVPGSGTLIKALQGTGLTYQWLFDGNLIAGATDPDFLASEPGRYQLLVTNSQGYDDTSASFILAGLPSTLTDLSARRQSWNHIHISWVSHNEKQVRGFEVERKMENESSFYGIGFINSQAPDGSYTGNLEYSFDDTVSENGFIEYRLRQVDQDGRFHYSAIIPLTETRGEIYIRVVPNPARNQLNIIAYGQAGNQYEFEFTDGNGKLLKKGTFGGSGYQFPIGMLQRGGYYLKVINKETRASVTKKVLIE